MERKIVMTYLWHGITHDRWYQHDQARFRAIAGNTYDCDRRLPLGVTQTRGDHANANEVTKRPNVWTGGSEYGFKGYQTILEAMWFAKSTTFEYIDLDAEIVQDRFAGHRVFYGREKRVIAVVDCRRVFSTMIDTLHPNVRNQPFNMRHAATINSQYLSCERQLRDIADTHIKSCRWCGILPNEDRVECTMIQHGDPRRNTNEYTLALASYTRACMDYFAAYAVGFNDMINNVKTTRNKLDIADTRFFLSDDIQKEILASALFAK